MVKKGWGLDLKVTEWKGKALRGDKWLKDGGTTGDSFVGDNFENEIGSENHGGRNCDNQIGQGSNYGNQGPCENQALIIGGSKGKGSTAYHGKDIFQTGVLTNLIFENENNEKWREQTKMP